LGHLPVNPLDDALVRHAVVAVVQHGKDDVLVDPDVEHRAGLDDLDGDGFVFAGGGNVAAGMVVEQSDRCSEIYQKIIYFGTVVSG